MSGLVRKLCAVALALACGACFSGAWASARLEGKEIIDIFPAQSWASMGPKATAGTEPAPGSAGQEDTAPAVTAVERSQEIASQPFEIVGEWREQGAHIFVLAGTGRTFILCDSACGVRGAIHPGEEIADGYRLKSLSGAGVTIVAEDGRSNDLHALELNS